MCVAQLLPLVLLTVENRKNLAVAKKDIVNLILIFLGTIYLALPVYVPQHLFGHVEIYMKRFTLVHFGWLAIMAGLAVGFYFIFRNKSYKAKYEFLLAVSWSLMMQFSQMFTATGQLGIAKLPLQLCNIASYLAILTLLTKSERLYHFMLIVNIVGGASRYIYYGYFPQLFSPYPLVGCTLHRRTHESFVGADLVSYLWHFQTLISQTVYQALLDWVYSLFHFRIYTRDDFQRHIQNARRLAHARFLLLQPLVYVRQRYRARIGWFL